MSGIVSLSQLLLVGARRDVSGAGLASEALEVYGWNDDFRRFVVVAAGVRAVLFHRISIGVNKA